jgi:hypothetical protein
MPGIVDGRAWLVQRKQFLTEELAKDHDAEQRAAIEAELAAVDAELASKHRHWWRWMLWGARPPQ